MNSNLDTSDIQSLLVDSSFFLPLPFAIWRLGDDRVFVSNKLCLMLSAEANVLDAYTFVKLSQRIFGSFINVATEKIDAGRKDYSSSVNLFGEEFLLKLMFFKEKDLYIFVLENHKKMESRNVALELEKILDALPVYVWQKNKDLKITYCNKAYAKALESSKEYIVSNNIKLLSSARRSHSADQNPYAPRAKRIREHVIINGSRRLLSYEEEPFLEGSNSTGFAIDITDQEELEKTYINYKKQTEEVLDNISVPIAIFDAQSVLVFANAAIIKLFSIDGLDLYHECKLVDIMNYLMSNSSVISSQDISRYKDDVLELFQTIIEPHSTTIHLKNGNTMALTISPNRGGGLIFMFDDISDKIALEREINSMSAVQIETLDHLSEGVVVFGADNRIKMLNFAANKLWNKDGGSTEVHISDFFKNSADLFTSDLEAELLSSKLINTAAQRQELSDTITLASGKTINYSYVPLPDGLNLVRFIDVSDSTNLAKTLQEKSDIISQIDKLKSNLISNISYELRAPLQTIKGFAEILFNRYFGELNEKQMEYCYGITNSVEKVTEIVDAVVGLANIEAGQLKIKYSEVKLLKLIQETIKLFADRAKSQNISLTTDFVDSEFSVFIDEPSMKQALFHLLSRSMRVTPSEGSVLISVEISQSDQDLFKLIIKDNGISLSEEDLERIRGSLTGEAGGNSPDRSTEFGLALANSIIKLHNGSISVESDPKGGNLTLVTVPIKQFLQ